MAEEGRLRKKTEEGLEQKDAGKVEKEFSKEQLLGSKRFRDRRDIVDALLSPDGQYTVAVVEQMVKKYMEGKVK